MSTEHMLVHKVIEDTHTYNFMLYVCVCMTVYVVCVCIHICIFDVIYFRNASLPIYLPTYLFICLSIDKLQIHRSTYLSKSSFALPCLTLPCPRRIKSTD